MAGRRIRLADHNQTNNRTMAMVICVVVSRKQIQSNDKRNVSIDKSAIVVISSCDGRFNIRTGGGNFN
jgi:hypothetical protein